MFGVGMVLPLFMVAWVCVCVCFLFPVWDSPGSQSTAPGGQWELTVAFRGVAGANWVTPGGHRELTVSLLAPRTTKKKRHGARKKLPTYCKDGKSMGRISGSNACRGSGLAMRQRMSVTNSKGCTTSGSILSLQSCENFKG